MTTNALDARLGAAWEAVRAARTARRRGRLLPAALRAAEATTRWLRASAPELVSDADRLAALVRAEVSLTDASAGDPWAFAREVAALRAERVPAHAIARSAIRVGACRGPATPKAVQRCAVRLRQERLRFRSRA